MTPSRTAGPGGPAVADIQALADVLASSFDVSVGGRRVVRRTVLDTFDRRLVRSGHRLQVVAEAGVERLELVRDGKILASVCSSTGPRWPAMADALPDGPLRDHVARRTGIRALLIVDAGRRRMHRVDLRNADGKIVVQFDVDEPAGGSTAAPPAVTLRPLPGCRNEADIAWRLVLTRLTPAVDQPVAPAAPGPAPFGPESPARALLAAELADFLRVIRENLPGTIADIDTEFLHDVRVAVRRTRSLLKLGRPALPAHLREVWEPQFKWLGDLTTPVRDLDVYQLSLPEMAGWLVAASAADLEPFETHLASRRVAERRTLLRALRGIRLRRLLDDWAEELSTLADPARSADDGTWSAGVLARTNVVRAHRRVVHGGWAVSASSPPEDLHVLRKRCKELRYALEMFSPVFDDAEVGKVISDLKRLQDVLGRFQDSEVQRTTLRGFARQMVADGASADPLLAMGELMGHLATEQQRARGEFGTVFASYVRPAKHGMARLLDGGRMAGSGKMGSGKMGSGKMAG